LIFAVCGCPGLRYTTLAGTNNEDDMKFKEIIEQIEPKPRTVFYNDEQADWVFASLPEQYSFIIQLVGILEAGGLELSDPPDGDGAVQRIDYLYLKNYEGFEISVYWDFKVAFGRFKYV
jgi:hypothetical protein